MMNKLEHLLGLNKYTAIKTSGEKTGASLIRILDTEEIGYGNYADVSKATVKIGNKTRQFAIKEFTPETQWSVAHSLKMHKMLKKIGIPTWNTYRQISENKILMTLGNDNGGLLFSAHNKSKDAEKLQKQPISQLSDENRLQICASALNIVSELSLHKIHLTFDAIMFAYQDNYLKILVGDLDTVDTIEDTTNLMAKNIEEMCYAFLRASTYFTLDVNLFVTFASSLDYLKSKGDERFQNIDFQAIFNKVYKDIVRESAG